MLQLKNIHKSYTTGNFTQVALDDVSISFRDNEFAAILGPSGSGKTTLLNIIGGLDHYDSGDLVIDGISTKDYKDKDWDTFRNNRIGFVFQSYNLIPHQTILANVELALTLSGVGREERRQRAIEALERVGLGDHVNKRPNQLSGGQMQRVAIARALINDPEILLADEPTGALDSKTSVQIMDLLTEIANDRLVIMVTHNPELADEYATRIVNLADGHILADTDPYAPTPAELARVSDKKVRRASMNFLTALSLSFNNLMTKKGRTIMTAFAGSIGIIGIAAILALANGVSNYITSVEEETLSVYPLEITSTGFDITSMMSDRIAANTEDGEIEVEEVDDVLDTPIGEVSVMTQMFGNIESNDLASLKEYLESGESDIDQYASGIEYAYDVTPYIFEADTTDGVQQVNPDSTFSALGLGSSITSSSLMSSMMSTDMFGEMMDLSLIEDQYEVVYGTWPQNYNECVLVLSDEGTVSDFLLYVVGLRDRETLDEMVKSFVNGEDVVIEEDDQEFTYADFMNLKLKLVNSADFYQYDEEFDVWVDKSGDEEYMRALIDDGEDLVFSGIVKTRSDVSAMALGSGIYYTSELVDHIIEKSGETQIVKDQLANPSIDVFSGKAFGEDDDDSAFDMDSLFTVDEGALSAAFAIDESKLSVDLSSLDIDFDSSTLPAMPEMDLTAAMAAAGSTGTADTSSASSDVDYSQYVDYSAAANMAQELIRDYISGGSIEDYMKSETAQKIINENIGKVIDFSSMQAASITQAQTQMAAILQPYLTTYMASYMSEVVQALTSQMQSAMTTVMTKVMSDFTANLSDAFSIDTDAFAEAFQFNMDEDELSELIMSMMSSTENSYDNNLAKLDYADLNKPSEIDIYAKNFEAKEHITAILDDYNDRMEAEGYDDRTITYTDLVGTLMSSVTTIIDMISYVLIAFVSISLIVSSIMIGVITYISVLERKKEIGILRAIGASKGNISEIFNAETVIEGLISGVLGVGVTALCCIPASAIVYSLFDVPNVASLPWMAGVILILISVALSFIAGLIPASSASRKDPVEALRSE